MEHEEMTRLLKGLQEIERELKEIKEIFVGSKIDTKEVVYKYKLGSGIKTKGGHKGVIKDVAFGKDNSKGYKVRFLWSDVNIFVSEDDIIEEFGK